MVRPAGLSLKAVTGRMTSRAIASQASFDPPGFTVAVKRDRAAEALLLTGARFVVSIIAEGAEKVSLTRALGAASLPHNVCMLSFGHNPPAASC